MKVRKEEIRAPSIDEQSDELKTASPAQEPALPVIPPPKPESTPTLKPSDSVSNISKQSDTPTNTSKQSDTLSDTSKQSDTLTNTAKPDTNKPEKPHPAAIAAETKENKPVSKPTDRKNYDATLSAPEVAQKYFVPRPKNRIATKNISFNKSKSKKPKYGRGSSPRTGTGLSPQNPEGGGETAPTTEGDRRQLPSRKSRPQQLLDDERAETSLYEDQLIGDDGQ